MDVTVGALIEALNKIDKQNIVMCGHEGLSIYKPVGNGKHDFVAKIAFDNEKKRAQSILFAEKRDD